MAEDLLQRILHEVRERKEAARAAYEESVRLQAALDALGDGGSARAATTTVTAAPVRRTPRGENRRRILEVVEGRPGASAGEVAQVTGIARPTVASTLAKLASDGEVERVDRPAGGVGLKLGSGEPAPAPGPETAADAEPEADAPADGPEPSEDE